MVQARGWVESEKAQGGPCEQEARHELAVRHLQRQPTAAWAVLRGVQPADQGIWLFLFNVEYHIQFCVHSPIYEHTNKLEQVQQRATKIVRAAALVQCRKAC